MTLLRSLDSVSGEKPYGMGVASRDPCRENRRDGRLMGWRRADRTVPGSLGPKPPALLAPQLLRFTQGARSLIFSSLP